MPDPTVVQLLRDGIAAARSGDKVVTRQLLTRAVELDAENEVAWLWLAGVAESPQQALECLTRVLAINPANERARAAIKPARFQAAVSLAKAGHKAQAKELLEQVVREEPNQESARLWLAGVTDDPDEAIDHLQAVLKINPNNANAQAGLARMRPRRVEQPEPGWRCPLCRHQAERASVRCPRCHAVVDLMQVEQIARGGNVDARRLEEALERLGADDQDADGCYHQGLALVNLWRFSEATAQFQKVIRLQPGNRSRCNLLLAVMRRLPELQQLINQKSREAALKTVLVIDDSPTIRKVVSLTLAPTEHRVVTAAGASEAIDLIRAKGVPNLIFLDIMMPGMDGYELCKLLRQTKETSRVPVIMLSGKDGFFSKVRGRMCGASGYITKPFEGRDLVELVNKYCGVVPAAADEPQSEPELAAH